MYIVEGGDILGRTQERRAESRTATVFRPVLLETAEFAGFCLVRNLSSNGMMGHVYTEFAAEQPVTLQFGPEIILPGTLLWCKDGRVGVQFDQELDVKAVLTRLGQKVVQGKINRAPRLPIQCKGELIIGDRILAFELQDISQRGIKLRTSFVQTGDEVRVQMEGFGRRNAVVRWARNGTAGLNFIQPLSFEELARWVVDRQAGRFPGIGSAPTSLWVA